MEFEWDEEKRLINIAKHGIDFVDAASIWLGDVIDPLHEREVEGEERKLALGAAGRDETIIAIVYTVREGTRRLISARRARRYERKNYQNRFGRGA